VLDKHTGRLVAEDDAGIGPRLLHGQWSSPSLGRVGDKTLVFLGGGDGVCYAFEALATVPDKPVRLKTVWSCDCNPPEYKVFGDLDLIAHYSRGDRRRSDHITNDDGTFAGMSEIIATPVFHQNRVYVANGRDPEHGRGRGMLWCIDATQSGDITATGKVWTYQGLDRSLSTVSLADGLLYVADVAGRLHCLDAGTGQLHWIHETKAVTWGSTLVADGKVYLPTQKALWVLAAGQEKQVLGEINLGTPIWSTPVAANGVLYIASKQYLWAVAETHR
jgi:outer membrane protein assembly factor BamB